MRKWLIASCLAVGLSLAAAGLQTAQAQFGFTGGYGRSHCDYGHHHHHHGGYGRGYSPYGSGYRGYSSYYASPGMSITRGSFYPGGLSSPFGSGYGAFGGLGGYGNYGYLPSSTLPRVQLRLGF